MPLSNETKTSGIRVGKLNSVQSRFICLICSLVLRDPVQGSCGHRFCKHCIAAAGTVECVACKEEGEDSVPSLSVDSVQSDAAIAREMNRTKFHCPSEPQCDVRLPLQELMQHAEFECKYRQIACGLCGDSLVASDLENHQQISCKMRPVLCDLCKESVPRGEMEQHKNSKCPGSTRQCESCTARVRDSDDARLSHAMHECPVGWVDGQPCPFGCGVVPDAAAHRTECVALHIDRLQSGMRIGGGQQVSDSGGAAAVGIGMEAAAASEPTTVEAILAEVDGSLSLAEIADSVLRYGLPHCPSETSDRRGQDMFFDRVRSAFTVGRELEKERRSMQQKLDVTYRTVDPLMERKQREFDELCKASDMYSELLRAMALKEVRICDLDRSVTLQELGSTDGTLVWKIAFFRERLSDTEYEPIVYSPILFTEKFGYKLSAVAYLNGTGTGRGTHISLFARLLSGPYDAAQRWPIRRTVTFALLDQASGNHLVKEFRPDQSSQFQRPSQPVGQSFGYEKFAAKDELEAKGFLKDDTLFVRLQVSKPTLRPGDF